MALSNKATNKLAQALAEDVAQYITMDDRFFDLLTEVIPEAIHDKLGNADPMVVAELSMLISEHLRVAAPQ